MRIEHGTAKLRGLLTSPVGLYAMAFGIAGFVPFVLLPVLTHALTPEEFGTVTFMLMVAVIMGNTAGLGAHGYVSVRYFKETADVFARTLVSCLTLVGVSYAGIAVLATVFLGVGVLQSYMPTGLWVLALLSGFAISLNSVYLATFQASRRPKFYLLLRALQGSGEIALCLLLLGWSMGLWARALSYPIAIGLSAILGLVLCFRLGLLGPRLQLPDMRGPFRFGLPMVPHVFAGTVLVFADRLIVSDILGPAALGIYMAAAQIGLALMLIIEPVNKAFAPWLFARLSANSFEDKQMVVRMTYLFALVLAVSAVSLLVIAHFAFERLVGPDFTDARSLLLWVTGGFVFQGLYYMVVNYLFFAERTGLLSTISVSMSLVTIAAMYFFTTHFGTSGAAIVFFVMNAANFLTVFAASQWLIPMPWLRWRQR